MSGTVPKLVITEIRVELVYFSFDKLSSSYLSQSLIGQAVDTTSRTNPQCSNIEILPQLRNRKSCTKASACRCTIKNNSALKTNVD